MEITSESFNSCVSPGETVIYEDDFGVKKEYKIASHAYDMCGSVVVKLEGKPGCVDIERISLK